ncbi:sensor histidine kinase [Bacillus cereus]|uniref:sensor histidine kinase n=1 Tax=Bacillus cereus TaxID=1396 RepID=UPI0015969854|nr:sensor histidine kinase [Bacillus cereus]
MKKIPFKVSSRAARLIGRENVSNAEGAVIELVKNAYDADANYCILYIDNQYSGIPNLLDECEYRELVKVNSLLSEAFIRNEHGYCLKEEFIENEGLSSFFMGLNSIHIVDDGTGMDLETIEKSWMTIGTDNKATDFISKKGRIKTGAKGIGRFALDRLGSSCEMWTLRNEQLEGHKWSVNWEDFEKENTIIDNVFADVNEIKKKEFLQELEKNVFEQIDLHGYEQEQIEDLNFKSFTKGTFFKISGLRDEWNEKSIKRVFASLDSLIPPKEERIFDIFLFVSNSSKKYGSVQATACEDYDYKVEAKIDENHKVKIIINRNEIDLEQLDPDVFLAPELKDFPFDKDTVLAKRFEQELRLEEIIPKYINFNYSALKNFTFNFYFLKRDFASTNEEIFKYRKFNPERRKLWLSRYGGIKIFRDYFRVRPYGEIKSSSFDWLNLSDRVQKSPAGIAKENGAWRIRPNQISGSIFISRKHNVFEDKSSREGLQETELFEVFQELIIGIITIFEKDRQRIMRAIKSTYDKKNQKENVKNEGKKIAEETLKRWRKQEVEIQKESKKEKVKNSEKPEEIEKRLDKLEKDNLILSKSLFSYEEAVEEKESELKLIRALAGTGIALTSLSHEIKTISAPLVTRNQLLSNFLTELSNNYDPEKFKEVFEFIDLMAEKDKVLKSWLDVTLNIVSKDKRRRKKIDVYAIINRIISTWYPSLSEKKITINLTRNASEIIEWRAHIIDIESIFNNLIINSLLAFQSKEHTGDRIIDINLSSYEEDGNQHFQLDFCDSGPGLSNAVKNKNEIFDPFFTTRTDDGTGLGLWIVKTTVQEYRGAVDLLDSKNGFALRFKFPLRKGEGVKKVNV